ITGSGSLVISGNNRLFLNSATGANTFTGGLVINSTQQVLFQNSGQAGAGTITVNGGAIASNVAGIFIPNAITFTGAMSLGGNGNNQVFTLTGPVTLSGNVFVDTTATVNVYGVVSGNTASLTLTSGAGTLLLANADTYGGGTYLAGGILQLGNNTALGSGAVTFAGGTLNAAITLAAVNNTINLPNTTANITGATNLNFTGQVNL